MSRKEMQLVNLLCEQIGIKTLGDLDEFKKHTKATTNEMLLKRLALFVASGITFKEAKEYERIFNKA